MKTQLMQITAQRMIDEITPQNAVKIIKNVPIELCIDTAITTLYMYSRGGSGKEKNQMVMAEVISPIGHALLRKIGKGKDSFLAAKMGAFILYSFEVVGILHVVLGGADNGHATYVVKLDNEEALNKLWGDLDIKSRGRMPSLIPYEPWESAWHACGATMVKTSDKATLMSLKPEAQPLVFEMMNKAQRTGWSINAEVYNTLIWAFRNKADAFAEVWEMTNAEARASKTREVKSIIDIASKFIGKTFYHLYYMDFRGRKYPATSYLHEQGTDASKGLLLRQDCKPIGEQGFFWLMISIASNWAGDAGREDGQKTDKIPLNDRVYWALDNEEILLSYADNPKVNQGWMKADKPWQFLAACIELRKLRNWQQEAETTALLVSGDAYDAYGYETHLECFIDGSNNGCQHLSALTKDEVTAPHVNLVPSDLPGDLYKYVADHVWKKINAKRDELSASALVKAEALIDNLLDLKMQIHAAAPKSDRRKELIEAVQAFRKSNAEAIKHVAPVFWSRITDSKQRRKVSKRNVMTLPYGGSAYGLGTQQNDDARKHGIPLLIGMEHTWGGYMGRAIYEDCRESLQRPMRLLSVFEDAGKKAESDNKALAWKVPVTNFPVVQNYVEGVVKPVRVQYGPPKGERLNTGHYENTYLIRIACIEILKMSRGKQSAGASPNAIHSLDAAHLTMTVCACDFPVTTIHDSFGCLLSDMADLYIVAREQFVKLYEANPLESIMKDIGGDISKIEMGNLDVSLVIDSEYCFA